jgi:site-specific DNA recombinase
MRREGLRTRGGYSLARSRVADLLSDPFYIGKIRWKETVYPGQHAPLVTRALFERCQATMHGRGTAKYRTHLHLFKGLIRCKDCGGLLTWEKQKGIVYGHCSSYRGCLRRPWYKEADFEALIAKELGRFRLTRPRLAEWVRKALREVHAGEIEYRDAALKELHDRHTRFRQQQDMLYADRLDRRISTEFYDAKRAEIESELDRIQESMRRHSEADKKYFDLGINLFELSQLAPDIFMNAEPEKKRKLLTLMCQEIYTVQGRLVVRFTDTFYALYQLADALNRSKQANPMPSHFEIFERQKLPYFDLQKGGSVLENDACSLGGHSSERAAC